MNIDEVVAIWKSRGLIADKMLILKEIQENLREGLSLDLYRSKSPVPDTIWVRVRETISADTVQLRYIDNESFKDYFKPKLKFSLRLTGDCDLDVTADTTTRAKTILKSTAWTMAELRIGDAVTYADVKDTILINGPQGYMFGTVDKFLHFLVEYAEQDVEFSYEVNPRPVIKHKPQ